MQEVLFLLLPLLLHLGRARLGSSQCGQVLRCHGFALKAYRHHVHWEARPPALLHKVGAALSSLVSSLQALGVFHICVNSLKVLTTARTFPASLHPSLGVPGRAQLGWGVEEVLQLLLAVGTLLSSVETQAPSRPCPAARQLQAGLTTR